MNDLKFKATNKKTGKVIIFTFEDLHAYEGEVCGIILPDHHTVLVYNKDQLGHETGGLNPDLLIELYTETS